MLLFLKVRKEAVFSASSVPSLCLLAFGCVSLCVGTSQVIATFMDA